ncbi:MAG: alanine racemase [Lachnospiraceae bacterium]|nr:alanine racemase [Lachnospiraceae bacterium]MCI9388876.1 alanine racemase [Lachnospiraceae bacterium]MCI9470021.1 alanine racemase [Lachnospiraceae bacterium]
MEEHRRVCAHVDLDAVLWNLQQIHEGTAEGTRIVAVIKADGYGHGAVPIARKVEGLDYLWGFAVATAEEAYDLREAGIRKPIMILGYTFEEDYARLCREKVTLTVFTLEMAQKMSKAACAQQGCMEVHLAVDTGMTRIGSSDSAEGIEMCAAIAALPGLHVTGLFTHFARADEYEQGPLLDQFERYQAFADALEAAGVHIKYRHCSNSAAIMNYPAANLDLVRAGIILYGLFPSDEVYTDKIQIRPVMGLTSHVVYVKDVEAGVPVSYGGTYVTPQKMRIATVPVGYGDGYPRGLSNKGYVLLHGQKAPILGRVCMDQFMVDVSHIPQTQVGDMVTLIGKDGDARITMEELGDLSGRFNYEFACDITARVPRVYK